MWCFENGTGFEMIVELAPGSGSVSQNAYTRGLSTGLGPSHVPCGPDVQITAPFRHNVCQNYLYRLAEHIAYGGDVRDGAAVRFTWYPYPVKFRKVDRNYVRAVFADRSGHYPGDPLYDGSFAHEMY